ncbi:MAG: cupin domain-containing protein [Candidatus Sericytochromatia bacterium]|nr:cupin domain-containing protein [Candidatus Tanganyikabacteria bacterium]
MKATLHKNLASPDETRMFEKGRVDLVRLDGDVVGRFMLEPGWHWEEHVKPMVGTDWCEVEHYQVVQSGRLHVKESDGAEFEIGPGEVAHVAPGHDAWVVGDEPFVAIDWGEAGKYAKR